MLNYIEYLKVPSNAAAVIIIAFFVMQIVGEILEFKGKLVPEFLKIRKFFARKKTEREILRTMPETLKEIQQSLNEFKGYYNSDNIALRNKWIDSVNTQLQVQEDWRKEFGAKLDKNNEDTLNLLIENKRNTIIDFASYVIDENKPVTREQFKRVFKIYEEYEKIILENELTNGEVDIAIRIIREAYELHMKNRSFLEDVRGYA